MSIYGVDKMWKNELKKSQQYFEFETDNVTFTDTEKRDGKYLEDREVTVFWSMEFGVRKSMFRDMGVSINKVVFNDTGEELDIDIEGSGINDVDPDKILHSKVSPVDIVRYSDNRYDVLWSE